MRAVPNMSFTPCVTHFQDHHQRRSCSVTPLPLPNAAGRQASVAGVTLFMDVSGPLRAAMIPKEQNDFPYNPYIKVQ